MLGRRGGTRGLGVRGGGSGGSGPSDGISRVPGRSARRPQAWKLTLPCPPRASLACGGGGLRSHPAAPGSRGQAGRGRPEGRGAQPREPTGQGGPRHLRSLPSVRELSPRNAAPDGPSLRRRPLRPPVPARSPLRTPHPQPSPANRPGCPGGPSPTVVFGGDTACAPKVALGAPCALSGRLRERVMGGKGCSPRTPTSHAGPAAPKMAWGPR